MSRGDRRRDAAAEDAAEIAAHLSSVRRLLQSSILAQARRFPVPLTGPQLLALQVLVDEMRASGGVLSLSELSRRMELAHSTVSGIVTRLARRNLLQRARHPDDRRFISIELTPPVKDWLEHELPAARLQPLAAALASATEAERATIRDGLATLQRLLAQSADTP